MLKQKTLAVLGLVMITVLVVTLFVAYSYADPVGRSTENQEYGESHNHHWEEVHNDTEEFYHHHYDEIEEDRYHRHCCHQKYTIISILFYATSIDTHNI